MSLGFKFEPRSPGLRTCQKWKPSFPCHAFGTPGLPRPPHQSHVNGECEKIPLLGLRKGMEGLFELARAPGSIG
jgi:hypothetical protein